MNAFLQSIGYGQWILHALVLLPLVGVVPVLLGDERSAKRTALVVTTLEFILSVGLWWSLDLATGHLQLISNTPWIPSWGIHGTNEFLPVADLIKATKAFAAITMEWCGVASA